MRYAGNKEVVETIEQEIRGNSRYFEQKKPKKKEQHQHNVSVVRVKTLDVITIDSLFPVTFLYDGRNGNALVDIRDRDIGWLCKISPQILKLLAQLEPQFSHNHLHNRKNK